MQKEDKILDKNNVLKYILEKEIGRGSFGICYSCISQDDNKEYAIKILSKKKIQKSNNKNLYASFTKNEINLQKNLNSAKIVKIKEYFEGKESIFIVQEYCKKQSLSKLLSKRKHLTEYEVQNYIFQLIQGLQYLHSQNIIHRDLKPDNLFLDEKLELKIGDFGLCTTNKILKDLVGTREFMAPELWDIPEKGYSFEVDIWALGVVMYNLLTGDVPFFIPKMSGKIDINWELNFPDDIDISKESRNLIKQILEKNPKKRPSLNQIVYHEFFHKNKFPKFLDASTYDIKPSDEINNENEIDLYVDDDNNIILEEKLYDLVVENEEIIYENIEKYVINKIDMDNYLNFWVIDWKESKNDDIFYYELNNGLKGNIFKNTNIHLMLDINSDKFYEIKEIENKKKISEYDISNCPEILKEDLDTLLSYSKESKINSQNISQYLSSELNDSESLKNKDSNEIIESVDSELNSEIKILEIKPEIKSHNLIYIKDLIIKKEPHMSIYLLILSDNTSHIIFKEKKKNVIEIIINDDKNVVMYIDRKYNYKNVIKSEKWNENPCKNFIRRINLKKKMEFDYIKNKMKN